MTTPYNAKKLIATLPLGDRLSDDYETMITDVVPTTYIRDDGMLCISAEDGKDSADYYGEFRGGYPWINPALESWAEKRGYNWQWENPGAIVLCG